MEVEIIPPATEEDTVVLTMSRSEALSLKAYLGSMSGGSDRSAKEHNAAPPSGWTPSVDLYQPLSNALSVEKK